jgi:hypothetical protein
MNDLSPTDFNEKDLIKPNNDLSTYMPDEFCNVEEMLS